MSTVVLAVLLCCLCQDSKGLNVLNLDQTIGPVKFVNILYRHGERTPIDVYPNDPYNNISYWPTDWGQLTNAGKKHHFFLGKWLRKRYDHLIPKDRYDHNTMRIQSTDVDRTLMSALANTAGMFPEGVLDNWGPLKWQPIPVHTTPEILDEVLAMKRPCKRYESELKNFLASEEMVKIKRKYKDVFDYCTINSGRKIQDLRNGEYLFSCLLIEEMNNFTLPDWTKKVYPEPLKEIAGLSFGVSTYTTIMKRLKAGPLIKRILDTMKNKTTGEFKQNITIYSAHDVTVSALLNTIGIYNLQPPPFAALVVLELRMKSNVPVVTIIYKNSTDPFGDPHLLNIPGCGESCPLERLFSILNPVIPIDWEAECHQHELFDLTIDQPYNSLAIFAVVTATVIAFILLATTSLLWHKQTPPHFYSKLNIETL